MALQHLALARATLDRASEARKDPALPDRLLADPDARFVPVNAGRAPTVRTADGAALVTAPASGWPFDVAAATRALLGYDEDGVAWVTVAAPEFDLAAGQRWSDLRGVGTELNDTETGALTSAVAVLAWHAVHGMCSTCGHATDVATAGWTRQCPNCGREHYPRTDPAVIMAIVDEQDRVLLGRQAVWPQKRFSTLAGFVEPGETLEDAVRREVGEESGVRVGEVTYRGSQPWPFPASIMLGFRGEALSTGITVDGAELSEARWWTRADLAADLASGELLLPPGLSIARRLIEDWYGGPLEGDEVWR